MYEIKCRERIIHGVEIDAWSREVTNASAIIVEVGTTGYKEDGKASKGLTFIRLMDTFRTNMEAREVLDDNENTKGVEIIFRGDSELSNLIKALKFAYKTLKKESKTGIPAYLE